MLNSISEAILRDGADHWNNHSYGRACHGSDPYESCAAISDLLYIRFQPVKNPEESVERGAGSSRRS